MESTMASEKVTHWVEPVANFLMENLPKADAPVGWMHKSASPFETACDALVALGYAEKTRWGAAPSKRVIEPNALPRWDDVCVVVVRLAEQQRRVDFRLPDGSKPETRLRTFSRDELILKSHVRASAANIAASHGLGYALATDEFIFVGKELGLVSEGAWTGAAETVLWRVQPENWGMNISDDERFAAATRAAASEIPIEIGNQFDELAEISEQDIAEQTELYATHRENMRLKLGEDAKLPPTPKREELLWRLAVPRKKEMQRVFLHQWRLDDGWLSPTQASVALNVSRDPLATAICRCVLRQRYPHKPEFHN
jgi:hypothetical protein